MRAHNFEVLARNFFSSSHNFEVLLAKKKFTGRYIDRSTESRKILEYIYNIYVKQYSNVQHKLGSPEEFSE